MRTITAGGLLAVLAVTLVTAGCDIVNPQTKTVDIDVRLVNSGLASVHILKPGEGFAPSNQVQPAEFREVTVGIEEEAGVEFRAGRNGEVLASVTCFSSDAEAKSTSGTPARVMWVESSLNCLDWDAE